MQAGEEGGGRVVVLGLGCAGGASCCCCSMSWICPRRDRMSSMAWYRMDDLVDCTATPDSCRKQGQGEKRVSTSNHSDHDHLSTEVWAEGGMRLMSCAIMSCRAIRTARMLRMLAIWSLILLALSHARARPQQPVSKVGIHTR